MRHKTSFHKRLFLFLLINSSAIFIHLSPFSLLAMDKVPSYFLSSYPLFLIYPSNYQISCSFWSPTPPRKTTVSSISKLRGLLYYTFSNSIIFTNSILLRFKYIRIQKFVFIYYGENVGISTHSVSSLAQPQ